MKRLLLLEHTLVAHTLVALCYARTAACLTYPIEYISIMHTISWCGYFDAVKWYWGGIQCSEKY